MTDRRLHPLTLLFEAIRVGRAFIVPAIVGGASFGGGDAGGMLRWGLALLALPALGAAFAKFASFRYRLGADELVIDSGVLRRSRRVIPLARVQHIDIRQGPMQRLAGVAELRVETAGGDATEALLSVLGVADAQALRGELVARRRGETLEGKAAPEPTRLAHLPLRDLALAGATSNEVGLVAALLAGAFNLALQLGLDVPLPDIDPDALPAFSAAAVAMLVAGAIVLFVLVGWVFSVATAVLRFHDFTLEQTGDEVRKRFGLLSRREAVVPLRRIQAVRVEESLLRRALGLAALRVETAGGSPGERRQGGAEAFLPLARRAEVPDRIRDVLAGFDYGALDFHPVHSRSRRRAFIRYALPLLLGAAVLGAWRGAEWLGLLALLPLAFGAAHLHFRHLAYALAPGHVIARSGFLNRVTWVVPERKVQTLQVRQSPFQRRHGLASLVVDTAGGRAAVVDLHHDDALDLLARLARRVVERPAPGS